VKSLSTLFARIISGELPATIVYQDELVTAFRDINPAAPVHILIVPNKVIPTVNDLTEDDERTAGRMLLAAKKIADQEGVAESGYRLIINCNSDGGQEVYHLHMHLLGGRRLGRMVARASD
jgi:histidine triad (HIT) family protein